MARFSRKELYIAVKNDAPHGFEPLSGQQLLTSDMLPDMYAHLGIEAGPVALAVAEGAAPAVQSVVAALSLHQQEDCGGNV